MRCSDVSKFCHSNPGHKFRFGDKPMPVRCVPHTYPVMILIAIFFGGLSPESLSADDSLQKKWRRSLEGGLERRKPSAVLKVRLIRANSNGTSAFVGSPVNKRSNINGMSLTRTPDRTSVRARKSFTTMQRVINSG